MFLNKLFTTNIMLKQIITLKVLIEQNKKIEIYNKPK